LENCRFRNYDRICHGRRVPFRLPEYDRAFNDFVHRSVHAIARARSPLLAGMPVEEEGSTASSVVDSRDAAQLDLPSESIGFGITMDVHAVRVGDFDPFHAELDSAADELGRGLVGMFVKTMDQVTESTGNVVKGEGEITFELIYEALDKMEWSLTPDGDLSMPSLVVHPDMAEKLEKLPGPTPEQESALEALKRRKHRELLAGRRSRRLS
jgi:hypothetical protein